MNDGSSADALTIRQPVQHADDTLRVRFLAEGAQPASEVANDIAGFIDGATKSLDLALYDCRLVPASAEPIKAALARRRAAGVSIRLVYDPGDEKPQDHACLSERGGDFCEPDTDERVRELGLPGELTKAATGFRALMHHKFMVRDGRDVWSGSLNFTQLWEDGRIENSGKFEAPPDSLRFGGERAPASVQFSPGRGEQINDWVARLVRQATRRIVICSMLITSSRILNAFTDQIDRGEVAIGGVYDRTQTEGALYQWRQEGERLQWKIDAVERLVSAGRLTGKESLPYRAGESHNFMHNKTLVIDELVLTGSYNLSHSAEENAENMLAIRSPALADAVAAYADELARRFAGKRHPGHARPDR